MRYYLPIHLDGDNRGCEAITKGTALILDCQKENIIALCRNVKLDKSLHIDDMVTLQPIKTFSLFFKFIKKIKTRYIEDLYKKNIITYQYLYNSFMKPITRNDVVLSTGGDMLCYNDNEVIFTNEELYKRGVKTILWGCSVGKKDLTPQKLNTLKHFSLIYARESITKQVLEGQGLKNVCLFPDPAFVLEPETCALPACFEGNDVVGINLSNFVLGDFSLETRFGKEVILLINYMLERTSLKILLIPHVLWRRQDDRIALSLVYERFKNTGRISVLDIEKMNYCQIRFVISKCRFFIGSRTHAVISAYSTGVPTLALGYSIKSHGIARDLCLPVDTIVDCLNAGKGNDLLQSFKYLQNNEQTLKEHLENVMPEYRARVWGMKDVLRKIITA